MILHVGDVKNLETALNTLRPGEDLEVTRGSELFMFISKAKGFGKALEPLFGVEFHKASQGNRIWFHKPPK